MVLVVHNIQCTSPCGKFSRNMSTWILTTCKLQILSMWYKLWYCTMVPPAVANLHVGTTWKKYWQYRCSLEMCRVGFWTELNSEWFERTYSIYLWKSIWDNLLKKLARQLVQAIPLLWLLFPLEGKKSPKLLAWRTTSFSLTRCGKIQTD